jgi:hypothetical protein
LTVCSSVPVESVLQRARAAEVDAQLARHKVLSLGQRPQGAGELAQQRLQQVALPKRGT